jgi:hypothetical protein
MVPSESPWAFRSGESHVHIFLILIQCSKNATNRACNQILAPKEHVLSTMCKSMGEATRLWCPSLHGMAVKGKEIRRSSIQIIKTKCIVTLKTLPCVQQPDKQFYVTNIFYLFNCSNVHLQGWIITILKVKHEIPRVLCRQTIIKATCSKRI